MIRWVTLAIVGVLIAAGASYAASKIATQPIGLSSEPINAGSNLAPRVRRTPPPAPSVSAAPSPSAAPTRTATPAPTVDDSRSDDSGGHGGSGGGHGGDD